MHETVFAKRIIEEAEKHGDVSEITIELGELGHVPPEELLECIQGIVDWKINSTIKKAVVQCNCGFEGNPKILERGHDHFFIECPECGEIPNLIDGTEVKLVSVKVK